MSGYLLDTNHATTIVNADELILNRIASTPDPVWFCRPAIAELWHGVHNSQRVAENRQKLEQALGTAIILEFDNRAAEMYRRIRAEQRRKGNPIPPIDAQIAAIARVHSLTILTADRHFDYVEGVHVDNWLA